MSEAWSRVRPLRMLGLAAVWAPALACAALVAQHAVNVPVWDDWERAKLLQRWHDGQLDFAFLYSPHIEHRILIPRLVALANARLFGSNLVLEMWLAWAIVLATALCVHGLLRRSLGERPGALLGTTFLANLLLFSPLQWENFLWASQPFFLFPMAALCAALLVIETRWRPGWKFAACLGLALVSTHTFSHGIPIWPAVFAAVLLRRDFASRRARVAFLAVWTLAAVAVLVPYFTVDDMRSTSEPSHAFDMEPGQRARGLSTDQFLSHPARAVHFYAAMLGSPFSRTTIVEPGSLAVVFGAVLTGIFVLVVAYGLARWRDPRLWDRWLPLTLLGGYALGLCAVAAVGRTAWGVKFAYALLPHYVSFSHYVMIATLALGLLAVQDLRERIPAAQREVHEILARVPALAAGLVFVAVGFGWLAGMQGMDEWESARLEGRTALTFLDQFKSAHHRRLEGSTDVLDRMAHSLDRYGYLDPPLLHDRGLGRFEIGQPLPAGAGRIERAIGGSTRATAHGWAWLPGASRRADGVLFVARDARGERVAVGLAEPHGMLRVVVPEHDHLYDEVLIPGVAEFSRWSGVVRARDLPAGDRVTLEVFAVDGRAMRLHRLPQQLVLSRTGAGLEAQVREEDR